MEIRETMVPNRSGSAPPSMEGSFAAFGNLMAQQSSSLSSSLESLNSAIENCESEEQLRSDPAYFAYYYSNVNLNPRLPPPIISRENRHLVRSIGGGFSNNWRLTSFDDSGNGSLHLSTHSEEPEDDKSPRQASNDWAESSSMLTSGQSAASMTGRHKSLEDFPRTPSPVYNQSRSSSHATTEEPVDRDVQAISLDDLSIDISKLPESKSGSVDICVDTHTQGANVCELTSNDDPSVTSFPKESYPDAMGSSTPPQKVEVIDKDTGLGDEDNRNKQENQSYEKNVHQQHLYSQQGITYPVRGVQAQLISQKVSYSHSGMEKVSHGHPSVSSGEFQPVLHPPGLTPPLYATAAAYMTSGNPFYPTLHPSGLYAPTYPMGGYALGSAFLPPFFTGYPSPTTIPMHFDATSGQSFSGRTASGSTGGEHFTCS
ncbi:hypothetical protein F0562_022681 [Nyssa sinensis]|uniref:Nucleic acid binding NABP domain-containing protein n=1 Tax=Nyssa sinensis TaxID=561372 RepID=A0A5J5BFM5_9ASTE|nr:hypothetical protein F0562_022681 [Nyssa sinensis]